MMKKQLFSFVAIACFGICLLSCGGSGKGVSKDTKADFQLDDKALQAINDKADSGGTKEYMDKIIETKGFVKSCSKNQLSSEPNKYSFYLCSDPAQDDYLCTICYSEEDQTKNIGKQVTVKGKFDYAGTVSLVNCTAY